MDLKVSVDFSTWNPSDEERLTAKIHENNRFESFIKSIRITNKNSPDVRRRSHNDIDAVSAHHCLMMRTIPTNLTDFFPNLIALDIMRCGIKEISRSDLKNFKMLREICLRNMEIEVLPGDLFLDLECLEGIEFMNNKIVFIGKDIFKHLKNLKFVNLSKNPGIDLFFALPEYKGLKIAHNTTRLHTRLELNAIIDAVFHTTVQNISPALMDVQKILENEEFKDFTIKIGKNELKVHKIILIARSPTIAEMIKNNLDVVELVLEDIELKVFRIILDFIYDDKLPQKYNRNTEKVFAGAGKLKLEKLKNYCGELLCKNVNIKNSLECLRLAKAHQHNPLKTMSIQQIRNYFPNQHFDDKLFENHELLKMIVEEKIKADEKIQSALRAFNQTKI